MVYIVVYRLINPIPNHYKYNHFSLQIYSPPITLEIIILSIKKVQRHNKKKTCIFLYFISFILLALRGLHPLA